LSVVAGAVPTYLSYVLAVVKKMNDPDQFVGGAVDACTGLMAMDGAMIGDATFETFSPCYCSWGDLHFFLYVLPTGRASNSPASLLDRCLT
jgi:hypothetical protein